VTAPAEPREALLALLKSLSESGREERLELLRQQAPASLAERRELLDWSEIEVMAAEGVDFESHGASHAILTGLPAERVESELARAREQLRERGLAPHDLLAYPSGGFDQKIAAQARAAGYRAAFTTRPRLAGSDDDAMALPRLPLHQDVSSTRAEFHRMVPGSGLRS
jgi:hypothetical protein